jgi:hypothetical protein
LADDLLIENPAREVSLASDLLIENPPPPGRPFFGPTGL